MKLWFRENKRIWTPTFTFESETWTKEKRKWEDVEAVHVELFRPLVGALRTYDVHNEFGDELGEVFSLLSRHKNLSRITGVGTKKLKDRI